MSIENPRVGVLAVGRSMFDVEYAKEVADQAWNSLQRLPLELVGKADIHFDEASARETFASLKAANLDMLLLVQVTFTDTILCAEIADGLDIPFVVWSFPEPRTGGPLRLNSFCGVNLAAHTLSRRGLRLENVHGNPGWEEIDVRILQIAQAAAIAKRLTTARILVIGDHPEGFDSCNYHSKQLKERFGIEIETMPVSTFIDQVKQRPDSTADEPYARRAKDFYNLADMDPEATRKTLKVYSALRDKAKEDNLAGIAVRCWPEFFTQYGCAACGALALMNEDHCPGGCEADVFGVISSLLLQWVSGRGVFNTDLVDIDLVSDTVVFWHCGQAPIEMADPDERPRAAVHPRRKLPLISEFPLKAGRFTLCRVTQSGGKLRMMLGAGEMLKEPMAFAGTSGVARLDIDVDLFRQRLLDAGMEHHTSLVYGEHRPLLRQVARYLDLEVLELTNPE